MLSLVSALAALAAVLQAAGGVWVGWLALGRPRSHGAGRDLLVAAWIGCYLQSLIVLLVGWCGLLSPIALAAVWLAPVGAAVLDRRAIRGWIEGALHDYRTALLGPPWVRLLAAAALGWLLLQLLAPPVHYDLLTYGFGQPMHWLTEGRIGPVGPDAYAYEAVPARMQFLLGLGLFGAPMVSATLALWVTAAGLLLARTFATWRPGREPWPLLAAVALWITPAIWDLLLLRKDDLAALWGGAALLLLFVARVDSRARSVNGPPRTGDAVALALAAAATLAAKPGVTAGFAAAVLVGVGWVEWRAERRRWPALVATAALVVAALLPLAAHAWVGLGHPLAPAAPYLSRYAIDSTRWQVALDEAYPWQPQPLARLLPYAVRELGRFYDVGRWNFGDNFGLLILLGLPPALLARRRPRLGMLWMAGMVGWFFTFHWPRFALVLLPLELLLVLELLRRTAGLRRAGALLAVVASFHAWGYATLTVTGVTLFRPALRAAVTAGAPPSVPPSVSVCEQANARLSAVEHRILFLGETRSWPCAIPFDYWNAHFRHPFERLRRAVPPESTWDRYVAEHGITHIVYSPQVARRRMEWSETMHRRLEHWLATRGRVLTRAEDHESATFLIELHG